MNCILLWLFCNSFSFCHHVVFFICLLVLFCLFLASVWLHFIAAVFIVTPSFILFMQSNPLHFIAGFCHFSLPFWHAGFCLFGHALVFLIHPLVLLFVFSLFVYDCVFLWFFLLGMLLSFLFIHCFFFFLSFACLCMIAFHCGFCTLLSFAVIFLIPPLFVLFIQLKELHFLPFFVLGFSLAGMLLSFYSSVVCFIYSIK